MTWIATVAILVAFVSGCKNGNPQPAVSGEISAQPGPSVAAPGKKEAPSAETEDVGAPPAEGDAEASSEDKRLQIALLPFEDVDPRDLEVVESFVEDCYGARVDVLDAYGLPASAYYKPRKRYRAERLLKWLSPKKPAGADRIVGITNKDISTTKGKYEDWGVCGLAYMPGDAGVISTFRIKKKLGRGLTKQERREKFHKRLGELAAHELGHQLGLEHCPNKGCIMEDAKGTVTTFNHSTGVLCDDCKDDLRRAGFQVP